MPKEHLISGFSKLESTQVDQWDKEIAGLVSSLAKKEDIELKSDLNNPMAITRLVNWAIWAENSGFTGTKTIVDQFIKDYLMFRVSYNRQGRSEIVRAISAINEKVKTSILGRKNEGENL